MCRPKIAAPGLNSQSGNKLQTILKRLVGVNRCLGVIFFQFENIFFGKVFGFLFIWSYLWTFCKVWTSNIRPTLSCTFKSKRFHLVEMFTSKNSMLWKKFIRLWVFTSRVLIGDKLSQLTCYWLVLTSTGTVSSHRYQCMDFVNSISFTR